MSEDPVTVPLTVPVAPVTFAGGRYRVVGVLGEGAQATTFDAVDVKLGQAVALKRFRVRGAKSWKEVELAEREARVLADLSHPLLPHYVDHFEEGGELFLVTEKIEGESLAALRKRGVTFGQDEVVRLLRDASDALGYLHGRAPPIVHRDLKPGNVIRRPDGSFAFIDFGAVRDRMKPEGGSTVVGTFGYMAPEQFQGRAMPASDVYAMGATALSLLTGREPEDLPHKGLGIDVPEALSGSRVSPGLVDALSAMLVPDPDARATAIRPLLGDMAGEGEEGPGPAPVEEIAPQRGFTFGPILPVWIALVVFIVADPWLHSPSFALTAAILAGFAGHLFNPFKRPRPPAPAWRRLPDPPKPNLRIDAGPPAEQDEADGTDDAAGTTRTPPSEPRA